MLITITAMAVLRDGVTELMIGTLRTDSGHIDGTPEFVESTNRLLSMQEGGMRLTAPAIELTATDLIKTSKVPWPILGWAHSCHSSEYACGECGGCRKHYRTMEAMGVEPY
jgi:7-cyano-7-deazaguanine synthase